MLVCFAGEAAEAGQVSEDQARRTLVADERAFKVLGRPLAVQREVVFTLDCGNVRREARARQPVRSIAERMCRLQDS
eukprot:5416915-Pyramimonas_sp.AAC.1